MATSEPNLAFSNYLHRLEFEHELINRKITWMLSTQAILFAAYGITLSRDALSEAGRFQTVIAISGMFMSLLIMLGILATLTAKFLVWRDYRRDHNPSEEWGIRTRVTWVGLLPDVFLPLLFAVAWLIVLVQ